MTTTTKPTMYENLKAHLAKHMYRRGKHKGDAPADASNRGKNHYRVVQGNNCMSVKFHYTSIITAYDDGHIELNMDGYEDSPTTRVAYEHAMAVYGSFKSRLDSVYAFSLKHTCVYVNTPSPAHPEGHHLRYYMHMMFDKDGNLLSKPELFPCRKINRTMSTEFHKAIRTSGFNAMYPLLFASVSAPEKTELLEIRIGTSKELRDMLTDPGQVARWATIVGKYKHYGNELNVNTCRAAIMADAKRDLYYITNTDVTNI